MDDVLDLIQDTRVAVLYDIQQITPEAVAARGAVLACAERVQAAVKLHRDHGRRERHARICQEIDRLESEADHVMRAAISKLFRDETDVRQLMKISRLRDARIGDRPVRGRRERDRGHRARKRLTRPIPTHETRQVSCRWCC